MRWQLACVWPDTGRLDRTRLALDLARDARIDIVEGDAVEALGALLGAVPPECLPVVVTTWALAYLPEERRLDFADVLQASAGHRPLAWISGEAVGVVPLLSNLGPPSNDMGIEPSVVGLVTLDRSDVDARVLGYAHPHGRWLDWSR